MDLLKGLDDDVIAFRLVALYHALFCCCFFFWLLPPCKVIRILKSRRCCLWNPESCKNIDFEGGTGIGELE